LQSSVCRPFPVLDRTTRTDDLPSDICRPPGTSPAFSEGSQPGITPKLTFLCVLPGHGVQRPSRIALLQGAGTARRLPRVRLQSRHVEFGLHVRFDGQSPLSSFSSSSSPSSLCADRLSSWLGWVDLPQRAVLPRTRQLRPASQDCKDPRHGRALRCSSPSSLKLESVLVR
jgi:hypothetical protein